MDSVTEYAHAAPAELVDSFSRGLNSATTKLHAARARPGKPSVDAFPDDATLELGEYAKHLKHCLARGGRGVEALLV